MAVAPTVRMQLKVQISSDVPLCVVVTNWDHIPNFAIQKLKSVNVDLEQEEKSVIDANQVIGDYRKYLLDTVVAYVSSPL